MPPKKQNNAGSAKKQQKIAEDKTFGLKNKNKSKKVIVSSWHCSP
jgi:hypothetical protein